jgi:hypothetical protein
MSSSLIILPGNGLTNKEWAEKARDFFASHFKSVSIQYYDHWQNVSELMDMDIELKKFTDTVNALSGDVTILAKSVGTILTIYAVHSKSIDSSRISKCVFVGLPPDWARTNGFDIDTWSADYSVPTILIQNDYDPVASAVVKNKQFVTLVFMATYPGGQIRLNPKEHDEYAWINPSDVRKYNAVEYVVECLEDMPIEK